MREPSPNTQREPAPDHARPVMGDAIAGRLGAEQGHIKLFDQRLEDAPDTEVRAAVDGSGLKLEVTW
jgi:hypothetical protein